MSKASNLREVYGVAIMSGAANVGKTAMVSKMLYDHFPTEYLYTIQDNMYWECSLTDAVVILEITDTAGSKEYEAMRDKWISEANGIMFVYAVDDRDSFDKLKELVQHIKEVKKSYPPSVVIGTKADSKDRQVTAAQGQEFASEVLACPFVEISSKNGENVSDAFSLMVQELRMQNERRALNEDTKSKSCCVLM